MAGAVGRPRRSAPRRAGKNPREEILDASAELFTRQGFATTSTHQIADAVGIRQASLYYHFPSKTEIFLTLLKSTVEPSTVLAEDLSTLDAGPEMRLWAIVASEVRLLLSTKWNVGRLYQLPIVGSEEFAEYHSQREALTNIFRDLATEIVGDDPRAELPFHITMSVIEMRRNDGKIPSPLSADSLPETAIMLADASLAVLGAPLPADRIEKTLELIKQADAK
ncbi:TetR family transcriptional regulator [Corynebacterium glutamicum]|uniref:TetR/AcrR family transcriptional regulator AmtR n=1 Tax=Corynebacterium glutamicum TaxID=1718 RepID=UPI0004F7F403|nr:TetR/AcrR family transcriptional regulator AmtR [Corynebacterium glutamicum]AIK84579.1 TetR family transcriptional regulator [Corynebacterium glutamicum]AIK87364.1 TetR family transcriptional regulator [Corynebacterium glutamicum]OKX77759.1 TetR family transcriptional regulator [Corynebacterium glutamicum]QDQ20403.1 TetR/AcrR family transcriptional regulator [Corynebacterium glutamicum]QDQ23969.1 TetR/AcrR family transcriptional regulator [Corynebacterium glutamicum]